MTMTNRPIFLRRRTMLTRFIEWSIPCLQGAALGALIALMLFYSIPSHAGQWNFKSERPYADFQLLVVCEYYEGAYIYKRAFLGICEMEVSK